MPDSQPNHRALVLTVAGLIFLSVVTAWLNFAYRDLWEPEELRYAEVAREMVVHGDWFLLRLNRFVYAEKPAGYFWSIALCSKLVGEMNALAVRLPTALAGFACCVLVFLFARRLYGAAAGVLSAFVLFTISHFLMSMSEARMDVLLTFCIMLSLYVLYVGYVERKRQALCIVAAWALWGLGTIIKGPVGLLLPLLTLVGYYLFAAALLTLVVFLLRIVYGLLWRPHWPFDHQLRSIVKRLRIAARIAWRRDAVRLWECKRWHAVGFALFLAIVAAWLVPACIEGGKEYTETILWKQNVGRYTRAWDHGGKPWAYYFVYGFPANFLPWTLFLPGVILYALRRRREGALPDLAFPAVWWFMMVLFFSFSSGKRSIYMIPAEPAAAMLVGWFLAEFWKDAQGFQPRRAITWPLALLFGACIPAAIAGVPIMFAVRRDAVPYVWPVCIVLGLAGGVGLWLLRQRRLRAAVALLPAAFILVVWVALPTVVKYVNDHKSARILLAKLDPLLPSKSALALFGTRRAGYSYYWGQDIPAIDRGENAKLVELLARPEPAAVLMKKRFMRRGKNEEVKELRPLFENGTIQVIWDGKLGGRSLTLIANYTPKQK